MASVRIRSGILCVIVEVDFDKIKSFSNKCFLVEGEELTAGTPNTYSASTPSDAVLTLYKGDKIFEI